ncbi:aminotransferase class IV [uncultured Muriicola sp.]|uniref:aminotransferase class IV n=1 Tax=uncultured Muriicola sp. TaxID=1583102 RepID=UPI00262824FB|nr:aminotransferase class IV [uncultured Muriicola sp.]
MINYDGELLSETSKFFNATNRGFSHGDALVETLRIAPKKIYFWEDHYLRLMASMRILRMEIPMNFTMEYLEDQILNTIKESGLEDTSVILRLYVFRKKAVQGSDHKNEVSFVISPEEETAPFYNTHNNSYVIDLYKDHYVQAGMISNLSTVNSVLKTIGRIYASENSYEDCILLNDSKNVVQTLKGNIFLVNQNQIITPPLSDGCKNGVLRKKIIELLSKLPEYSLEEASISPFALQKADELLITNIKYGIQSVTQYRKATYKTEVAKALLGKLNAMARLN